MRAPRRITWDPVTAQKGGYKHFLLKEIHEQPVAIVDTLRGRLCQDTATVCLDELEPAREGASTAIDRLTIVACGTAWHAGLVGRYAIERLARIPVDVDYGSEFRYRDPVADSRTLMVVVSQSGETADTLAAVEAAHERGAKVLADLQRGRLVDRAQGRLRALHARRSRDQRRQHQGVHDAARRRSTCWPSGSGAARAR